MELEATSRTLRSFWESGIDGTGVWLPFVVGDLRGAVSAASTASHWSDVHDAAHRTVQTAAGLSAPSCILSCVFSTYSHRPSFKRLLTLSTCGFKSLHESSLAFLLFIYLFYYFIVVQVQLSAFTPYQSPPTPAIPTSLPWFHHPLLLSICPL